MYNHFLELQDGRVLNTFTHRSNLIDDDGGRLGLRATLSTDQVRSPLEPLAHAAQAEAES